jgi:hypothetical protein
MIELLKKHCPHIWELFNKRAKRNPPGGITEFISDELAAEQLQLADGRVRSLINKTSEMAVRDAYRRDLSGVDTAERLAELFCEMTMADALAGISSAATVFRPRTAGGTACDLKIVVSGCDLYAEVKRFADTWEGGQRSIGKSQPGSAKPDADRPRAMDLFSKLKGVHRQFPTGTLNVLFLFHPSAWSTHRYIGQALFGDASSLDDSNVPLLYGDGLCALKEWHEVSACAHAHVNCDGTISIRKIWKNPKANIRLPDVVEGRLAAIQNWGDRSVEA